MVYIGPVESCEKTEQLVSFWQVYDDLYGSAVSWMCLKRALEPMWGTVLIGFIWQDGLPIRVLGLPDQPVP